MVGTVKIFSTVLFVFSSTKNKFFVGLVT